MQVFKVVVCLAAVIGGSAMAQVTNIITEGNLAVTHEFGCIPLADAQPVYTPPDFMRATLICINEGDFDTGTSLFGAALFYGMQDRDRVSDRSAPQGLTVLIRQTVSQIPPNQRAQFKQSLDSLRDKQSEIHAAFCRDIKQLGKPEYFPRYMVQHGMQAVLGTSENPLIEGFPADANWSDILSTNECQ